MGNALQLASKKIFSAHASESSGSVTKIEKKICQGAWILKTKQCFNYVTVGGVCDGSSTLLVVAYDKNASD
jgi:hypothetical protein